jgi:two-component system cell cycle sensor histidine kinase/response regulator CckA
VHRRCYHLAAAQTEESTLRILLLEDAIADADLVRRAVRQAGFEAEIRHVDSREGFVAALASGPFDLILSDFRLPDFNGLQALAEAQRLCPQTPFIVVSGTVGEDVVVDLLKAGVTDFVLKHQLARLGPAIHRAQRAIQERAALRQAEANLAGNMRITRSIIDATPALVYVYDRSLSRNLFVNDEARRLGYGAEQLRQMEPDLIGHLMHPDDVETTRRARQRLAGLPRGEALELTFRLRRADGAWRWFRAREVRFAEEDAAVVEQVLGIAQDVTAAHRMESRRAAQFAVTRALSESLSWAEMVPRVLEAVRSTIDAQVVELWLQEEPGSPLRFAGAAHADAAALAAWHQASRDLTFAGREGVIGFVRETRRSHQGEAPGEVLGGRMALMATNARPNMVAVPVRSGDTVHGVLVLLSLEPGDDEHLLALLEGLGGQLGDFRERRRAEERVREQAALLDHAREAIVVTGLDHRVRFWNKGAEQLYGHEAAAARGQDAGRLFGATEAELAEAWERVRSSGEWTGLVEHRGRSGGVLKVQHYWTLVRETAGAPPSVLIMSADVTEQKRLESELLRAQRLDSLGVLAGGIAHDLNNVLAPILMALDALKKRATDERSLRMFQLLEASASRGADLVRQILGFARGSEGQRLVLEPRAIAGEVEKMVREALPMSIEFTVAVPAGLWHVTADPTQLYQVLLNLCVNARDAMSAGGRLSISAENVEVDGGTVGAAGARRGPYVMFRVSDTGSGIAPGVIDRIFEPFFTTKEEGRGTGLGLSTAMTIVKGHDGFLTVASELGRGSSFNVYLPATRAAVPGVSVDKTAELPRGHGEVVLVADDEVSIREIAKEALEAFGYVPLLAVDGREAVDICAQRGEVAAVLMDVRMPVMDGPTAIRIIQRAQPAIKVIAVSGFTDRQQQALSAGACLFLAKPYTAAQLLTALRAALGEEST